MLEGITTLRKTISIPASCRERYVPLERPESARWRELGIHHSGVSDLVGGYHIGIPEQRSLMLIATVGGAGEAWGAVDRFALTPGTLLINPPGEGIAFATAQDAWSMVWWYLRPIACWQRLLQGPTRLQALRGAALLYAMTDSLIVRLGVAGGQAATSDRASVALGDAILTQLEELAPQGETPVEQAPLRQMWSEVEQRLEEPWPVAELARRMRVSVPTLQRLMHRTYQRSTHQYLLELRMRRAAELLLRSTYPLRVIAARVGFADSFTFSAAFHRHHGRPPSALRRAAR